MKALPSAMTPAPGPRLGAVASLHRWRRSLIALVTVAAGQPGDVNVWLPRGQTGRVYDVAVEAYSPGQWVNFAIGLATASGALTGLVFVAV